jgi:hypothetical protein
MKREILNTLKSIDESLTHIERRLATQERTVATKDETANIAIAVKDLRDQVVQIIRDRRSALETVKRLEDRVLNLERVGGVK